MKSKIVIMNQLGRKMASSYSVALNLCLNVALNGLKYLKEVVSYSIA